MRFYSLFSVYANPNHYVLICFPSDVLLSPRKQIYVNKLYIIKMESTEKGRCSHCKFQSASCAILGLAEILTQSNKWVISANCWELLLKFLKGLWITCVMYGVEKSHHLHISEDSLINSNKEIKVVWRGLRQKLKIKIDLQNFRSLLASKEIN